MAKISRAKKLLFTAVVLVVVLGAAEVLLRVLRREGSFLGPDSRLGYVNEPGFTGRWGVSRRVSVSIDAYGFRVEKPRRGLAPDVPLRVACLGDSCTFGFDVEAEEAYPAELGRQLRERLGHAVEILNAGVIGYSTRHGERLFRERIVPLRPDVVTVAYCVANRILSRPSAPDLSTPTFWTAGPAPALARHSELFELAYDLGLRWFSSRSADGGWCSDYRRQDDPLFAEKARLVAGFESLRPFVEVDAHGAGLRSIVDEARSRGIRVILLTFGENPVVSGPLEEAELLLEESRHAEAVRAVEAYFDEDKSSLRYQNNLDILANHLRAEALRALGEEVTPGGMRFPSVRSDLLGVVVRTQRRYASVTERVARETGARHLDLREPMNADPSLFLDWVHFDPRGHRVVAEALTEVIAAAGAARGASRETGH